MWRLRYLGLYFFHPLSLRRDQTSSISNIFACVPLLPNSNIETIFPREQNPQRTPKYCHYLICNVKEQFKQRQFLKIWNVIKAFQTEELICRHSWEIWEKLVRNLRKSCKIYVKRLCCQRSVELHGYAIKSNRILLPAYIHLNKFRQNGKHIHHYSQFINTKSQKTMKYFIVINKSTNCCVLWKLPS